MKTLAGDVGGTKTLLMLRDGDHVIAEKRYPSQAYGDLAHMVADFLETAGARPQLAALGVAGPVAGNRSRATNLPWEIDGDRLARVLGIPRVKLLNDFAAVGFGLAELEADDVVPLNDVAPDSRGPVAILGAGTGLGEGFLVRSGLTEAFLPSEGGHADFAPRTEREIGFLRFMLRFHKRVSIERAVSGPGIGNLFRYVIDSGILPSEEVAQEVAAGGDVPEIVSRHTLAGDCPASAESMDIFLNLFGAEAGNLALKILPTGGVYIVGGVAAKNLDLLRRGAFMTAYGDKGRLSGLVRSFPVRVVVNQSVGLLGAARVAALD